MSTDPERPVAPGPVLALVASAITAVCSMCGVGGGIYAVPMLHYGFKVPLRNAVATSLGLVAAATSTATVSELLHPDSALFLSIVSALVLTSLVGAEIGFWISKRLETRGLKALFVVVLGFVSWKLLMTTSGGAAAPIAGFVPTFEHIAGATLIGLCAGIVVPLLGVGGGLVVVPALLFGVPEIGYLGARACALAMGAVTSTRSLWVYAREGRVHLPTARWFAAGALVGAATGVWLVHQDGAASWGRNLLGATLFIAALRFAVDVLRPPAVDQA